MADGKVGVVQSGSPDRYIDNSVVTNDVGDTVYRQKVFDPDSVADLNEMVTLLRTLASVFGVAVDPAGGRLRVLLDTVGGAQGSVPTTISSGTITTVSTVTTVSGITAGTITTVSTLTNQAQMGGWLTNHTVMATMNASAQNLRSAITVS